MWSFPRHGFVMSQLWWKHMSKLWLFWQKHDSNCDKLLCHVSVEVLSRVLVEIRWIKHVDDNETRIDNAEQRWTWILTVEFVNQLIMEWRPFIDLIWNQWLDSSDSLILTKTKAEPLTSEKRSQCRSFRKERDYLISTFSKYSSFISKLFSRTFNS